MSNAASIKSFALAFRAQWFAAMSGGVSVPFAALSVFLDNKWAQLIFALLAFTAVWFAAYRIWSVEREKIANLEDRLRPKIKVLDVSEHLNSLNTNRSFDLEIKNDSSDELSNCLVKATRLEVRRAQYIDARKTDNEETYKRDMPIAFQTARNKDGGGGGPFHLRAGELKRIPICSRQDGKDSNLNIHFENSVSQHYHHMQWIHEFDLDVEIYGAPNPVKERLRFAVDNEGKLTVTRGI